AYHTPAAAAAAALPSEAMRSARPTTRARRSSGVASASGLFLVGLGWSFAYVGASVLLADATPLERRARVVGRADLIASLGSAAAAAAAGVWYAREGLPGLGLAGAALLVLPFVVVALRARPRAAAAT
ncbi:MAG TPA: hypothetical protein VFH78_14855, partial [Candidatus Thermoplasmatota archaeon]|nr:hypothetical protein [Candidatus Thermoplasmatota archaeon]